MKKIGSAILFLIFALQLFYPALITAWFYANRGYIAKNLCINRARPELKCNGKCYLCKKLDEAQRNQDQENPQQLKQWVETSPCTVVTFNYNFQQPEPDKNYITYKIPVYNFLPANSVFHPPASVS